VVSWYPPAQKALNGAAASLQSAGSAGDVDLGFGQGDGDLRANGEKDHTGVPEGAYWMYASRRGI
jgi:hypothetical protein